MTNNRRPILDSQAYITLGYLVVVIIGMMFDYNYYRKFSINIFEYADILDFLLAPVKNVQLMAFAIGTFIVVWIFFRLDKLWQDRSPKTYKRFNFGMSREFAQRYRPFFFGFTLIAYFYLASDFYGDKMYADYEEEQETIEIVFDNGNQVITGNLIGKNTDYIFLETDNKVVKAIPVSSDVQEIIIYRP